MTATFPKSAGRPSLGDVLAFAAALAALGLGSARLARELGPGAGADAPPALRATPAAPALGAGTAPARGPWPAMFGVPAPPVVVEEVAPPAEEPPPPAEEPVDETEDWAMEEEDGGLLLDYRLKGMIVAGESGWILVELDGEELVFRVGEELPGGERILSLSPEGALIEDPYGGPDVLLAPEAALDDGSALPAARIDATEDYDPDAAGSGD